MSDYELTTEEMQLYKEKIKPFYDELIHKDILDIDNFNYDISTINNIFNFININTLSLDKLNTVCIVFNIIRDYNIINYAYLYCDYDIENKNLIYKYITISPSLKSKYGEFRRRFIPISKLDLLNKYSDLLLYFEKKLNKKLNKEFKLQWNYYSYNKLDIKKFVSEKMSMNFYIILYIIELYNIHQKIQAVHTNEIFNETMFDENDLDIFKEYIKKNNINTIKKFIIEFSQTSHNLEYGQKIVPFSFLEFGNTGNIVYPQWKELIINQQILSLLYNFVSIGFPLYIDWFLIYNSDKNLYDNSSIFKKLLYSEQIFNLLHKDGRHTPTLVDTYNKLKDKRNIIQKYLILDEYSSNNHNHVNPEISLMTNILYSDYSICYIYEYVGDTLYTNLLNNKEISNDYNLFSKYLFEIIYNLYCLNLKGIFHRDLHLNNITIHKKFINHLNKNNQNLYNLNSNIHKNPNSFLNSIEINDSYDITDGKFIYKFENNELYTNIIDFNQSIMYGYNSKIQTKKVIEQFINLEYYNIISTIGIVFPEYIKNNGSNFVEKLKNKDFYTSIFVNLSSYDIYKLTNCLLTFYKNRSVNPKIIKLLKDLNIHSFKLLEDIIKINLNSKIIQKNMIFPNYVFLTTYFQEFNIKKNPITKKDIITNIFNIDNIKNDKNNTPTNQYDFYLQSVTNTTELYIKLLKINSKFFDIFSQKLTVIKKIHNLGKTNLIENYKLFLLLKKILEESNTDEFDISDF